MWNNGMECGMWNGIIGIMEWNVENDLILKKARISELEILLFEKPL